jgi:glycosyltransferase involved in cell wall biosynthesis
MDETVSVAPKVSIGIPAFNDERFVGSAIKELLDQSYRNIELIISDDASTDGTAAICKSFLSDPRVLYFYQKTNIGAVANFRFTLERATGQYFMWATSDDRHDPDFIDKLVDLLQSNPGSVSAFSPYDDIDEEDRFLSKNEQNYKGRSAIVQLYRFWSNPSAGRDVWINGIHDRKVLLQTHLPIWWGCNREILLNDAYPLLSFLLARGQYVYFEGKSLFRRRIPLNSPPRHSFKRRRNPLSRFAAMALLKANVFVVSCREVYRGSGSAILALATAPIIAYESLRYMLEYVVVGIRHRFFGIKRGYTP